jgi:hypothetical protein
MTSIISNHPQALPQIARISIQATAEILPRSLLSSMKLHRKVQSLPV